jgi:arsenite oxidase small subunit
MAFVGLRPRRGETRKRLIGRSSMMAAGGYQLFRYPTDEDPCILVREKNGELKAYSQVCTHLSCAVVYKPAEETLFCPCHHGTFTLDDGRPIMGPPTRRLPRIQIEQRGDEIWAVGREV